jgi:hypothetical protein
MQPGARAALTSVNRNGLAVRSARICACPLLLAASRSGLRQSEANDDGGGDHLARLPAREFLFCT